MLDGCHTDPDGPIDAFGAVGMTHDFQALIFCRLHNGPDFFFRKLRSAATGRHNPGTFHGARIDSIPQGRNHRSSGIAYGGKTTEQGSFGKGHTFKGMTGKSMTGFF